jgi:hypothetical protein
MQAYLLFRLAFVLGADMNKKMEDMGFELQRVITGQVRGKKEEKWRKKGGKAERKRGGKGKGEKMKKAGETKGAPPSAYH